MLHKLLSWVIHFHASRGGNEMKWNAKTTEANPCSSKWYIPPRYWNGSAAGWCNVLLIQSVLAKKLNMQKVAVFFVSLTNPFTVPVKPLSSRWPDSSASFWSKTTSFVASNRGRSLSDPWLTLSQIWFGYWGLKLQPESVKPSVPPCERTWRKQK